MSSDILAETKSNSLTKPEDTRIKLSTDDISSIFPDIDSDRIHIFDATDNLALFHFNKDVSPEETEVRKIRGVIVDKDSKKIIMWPNDMIDNSTEYDAPHGDDIILNVEGTMVNIFRYNDVLYMSTPKRIFEINKYLDRTKSPGIIYQMNRILKERLFKDILNGVKEGDVHTFVCSYHSTVFNKTVLFPHLFAHGCVTYIGTRKISDDRTTPYFNDDTLLLMSKPIAGAYRYYIEKRPETSVDVLWSKPDVYGTKGKKIPIVFYNNLPLNKEDYEYLKGFHDVSFIRYGDNPVFIRKKMDQVYHDIIDHSKDLNLKLVESYNEIDSILDKHEFDVFKRFMNSDISDEGMINMLSKLETSISLHLNPIERFEKLFNDSMRIEGAKIDDITYKKWIIAWVLFMRSTTPYHKIILIDHLRKFRYLLSMGEWPSGEKIISTADLNLITLREFPTDIYAQYEPSRVWRTRPVEEFRPIINLHWRIAIKESPIKKDESKSNNNDNKSRASRRRQFGRSRREHRSPERRRDEVPRLQRGIYLHEYIKEKKRDSPVGSRKPSKPIKRQTLRDSRKEKDIVDFRGMKILTNKPVDIKAGGLLSRGGKKWAT